MGLYGYSFQKKIFRPSVWLPVLIVTVLFGVLYESVTSIDTRFGMGEMEYYLSTAIGWIVSLPALYALYAYSKPTDPAWKSAEQC